MIYEAELINSIRDFMVAKKYTLSVAESVTSGHLQAAFSSATEASKFYQGGITAYNAGQKSRHLGIDPIWAMEEDSVSEKIAADMAINVNKLFLSDYSIAITGYATPVPEKGVYDLFAFFAIAFRDHIVSSTRITSNKKDPVEAQLDYTTQIVRAMHQLLEKKYARTV